MNKNYDDIINTDWHGSLTHAHMPLATRAKIFMPFAALKGFDELLKKKEEESKDRDAHDRLHAQPDEPC